MSIIISTSIASSLSCGFNGASQSSQFVAWKNELMAGAVFGVFDDEVEELLDGEP
jgi:hypothetical protein